MSHIDQHCTNGTTCAFGRTNGTFGTDGSTSGTIVTIIFSAYSKVTLLYWDLYHISAYRNLVVTLQKATQNVDTMMKVSKGSIRNVIYFLCIIRHVNHMGNIIIRD